MDATHVLCGRYRWQVVEITNLYNEDDVNCGNLDEDVIVAVVIAM